MVGKSRENWSLKACNILPNSSINFKIAYLKRLENAFNALNCYIERFSSAFPGLQIPVRNMKIWKSFIHRKYGGFSATKNAWQYRRYQAQVL